MSKREALTVKMRIRVYVGDRMLGPIDDNKITQSGGNPGTVDILAGCSEAFWRSQQTALALD
jgi:hypothetical protein